MREKAVVNSLQVEKNNYHKQYKISYPWLSRQPKFKLQTSVQTQLNITKPPDKLIWAIKIS